jgi:hypothetical protein
MRPQTCVDLRYATVRLCKAVPHTQIIQRLQSEILRSITNAPWYVSNFTLHNDLHIPFVTTEISRLSFHYHQRLACHHNTVINALTTPTTIVQRLKRQGPTDLDHATEGDFSRTLCHPLTGLDEVSSMDAISSHIPLVTHLLTAPLRSRW